MTVAVITANLGGYDECVDPPAQTIDATWHYFTDQPFTSDVWTVTPMPAGPMPRLAAKTPKCRPDLFARADVTVWLDASARLLHERSLEQLLFWANGAPIAQFAHPERDCIYAEVEASRGMEKYQGVPLDMQAAHYCNGGHPPYWGLWATGVIVYNRTMPGLGQQWLAEQACWGYQDQVSQAPVLRYFGLRPQSIAGNLWDNPAVGWAPHLAAA